ncbi:MAG: hypothetical protein V1655_00810 [bacterium]
MSQHNQKYNKNLDDIENIYKDYDSRFKRGKGGFAKAFLFFIFFSLIIALSLGISYYIFKEPSTEEKFSQQDVTYEIKGSEQIASGEEIFYIADYKNNSSADLANIDINISYPENFVPKVIEPKPADEKYNIWHLEELTAGSGGQIKIQGFLVGNVGDESEIKGTFKYSAKNTSASFTKKSNLKININKNFLELDIIGADKFKDGEANSMAIKYRNTSAGALDKLRLIIFYPKNSSFFIDDNEIKAKENNYVMDIEKMEGKEEKEKAVKVRLGSQEMGNEKLKVQIGYVGNNDKFLLQTEKEEGIFILKSDLATQLSINGFNENGFANVGDEVKYVLNIKNQGNVPLREIVPAVLVDDSNNFIDWESLRLLDGAVFKDNEIIWNYKDLPKLLKLEQAQEVSLEFSVKLKNDKSEKNLVENIFSNWAEVQIGKIGEDNTGKTVKSNLVSISLNTNLDLKTEVRYFSADGTSIGSGPLPPRKGETTTYRVFWKLGNSLNDAINIKITADIPDEIVWGGNGLAASGDLYFLQDARKIEWTIPKMPADIKGDLGASFDINVKPEEKDVGRSIIILNNITLTGADGKTNSKISKGYNFITTSDEANGGNGVVGE